MSPTSGLDLLGPVERTLERALDRATARHRLIASNVANLSTPGYKPRHLSFPETLARLGGPGTALELRRTDRRHLEAAAAPGPEVVVDGQARRPDGNGVDPEREMRDLTRNSIQYAALSQVLGGRIRTLRSAIQEGR